MRVGLEVLDSVKIDYKLVDNWKQYLEDYLLNENVIERINHSRFVAIEI